MSKVLKATTEVDPDAGMITWRLFWRIHKETILVKEITVAEGRAQARYECLVAHYLRRLAHLELNQSEDPATPPPEPAADELFEPPANRPLVPGSAAAGPGMKNLCTRCQTRELSVGSLYCADCETIVRPALLKKSGEVDESSRPFISARCPRCEKHPVGVGHKYCPACETFIAGEVE